MVQVDVCNERKENLEDQHSQLNCLCLKSESKPYLNMRQTLVILQAIKTRDWSSIMDIYEI